MITLKYRQDNLFHYNCSSGKYESRIDGVAELWIGQRFYETDFRNPGEFIDLKLLNRNEEIKGDII